MDKPINAGGVIRVGISHQHSDTLQTMIAYIHHELTPERAQELATLVEKVALRAIESWAAA